MGFINLLKNGYRGKLGETVGQKWKDQLTVRTYQGTNNSKSPAQIDQRAHYKTLIQEAAVYYSFFVTSRRIQPKGMNKFNLFTQFWDKSNGGLNPNYPKNPYFRTPTPGNIYFLSKHTSTAIFHGIPYTGPNHHEDVKGISYTFLLKPRQQDLGGRPTQFFLDKITVQKALWTNTKSGEAWECFTITIPGINMYSPAGIRQLMVNSAGREKYSSISNLNFPLTPSNTQYTITPL